MSILVNSPFSESEIEELGIKNWPIWTYEIKKTCFLLESEVKVTPDVGELVKFSTGDLVVFSASMACGWDVHKAVGKHYRFGD